MSLPEKFLKPFDAQSIEDGLYAKWLSSGLFSPDVCIEKGYTKPDAESFSIVLPPPNVTGTLHTGHSFMLAIQDIMVRYNRMQGKKTLWIPGTDHAAISTESVIVKQLTKEKTTKFELGREEFLKRVNSFAQESHDTIVSQTKKMGASLDWSREAFTLDTQRHQSVVTAFKTMYDDGLIYRGNRIVNWDPKGQTTVSDDEVDHEERVGKLYTFKYSQNCPIEIATTRPETKLGDTGIAVHPEGKWKEYIGQKFSFEFAGEQVTVTVVGDDYVDPEFGTGALGVTPAHSQVDFEIAGRHNLPVKQVINEYGKMIVGMEGVKSTKTEIAREKIVSWLSDQGLLIKTEDVKQNISLSQRTKAIIEPLPKIQWWIDVNKPIARRDNLSLKELMLRAVREDGVNIIPERFEKIYFNWIENLRDWNISRQIWYGHQIPVWYDKENNVHLPREQKFIFTRHGESQANLDKVYAGQADSPLTTLGKEQALDTAKKLHGKNISKIISSDLSRAYDTAQIIAKELGVDNIETWKELRNMDLGKATGTPLPDNSTSSKSTKKTMIDIGMEHDDGETLQDLENRAHEVIKKLQGLSSEGSILIVGHGQFTRILLSVLNGDKGNQILDNQRKITIDNLQIYEKTLFLNPTGENLTQDSDTLDTWFSSGLWTFSTLGWPENTNDLKTYHPTSVLETGHDIIFFWVARMVLMSTYLLGEIPFKTVYMHGMVLDKNGKKMSKSNPDTAIDPLLTIEKYGADALRMAMIVGVGPGQDVTLSEDKIKAYSKFANKIWNATRFVLEQTNSNDLDSKPDLHTEHIEYIHQWDILHAEISKEMNEFKYYLVSEKLYHFFWHIFADIIIEKSKSDMNDSARYTLRYLLCRQLIALHPFMPFITEEIWGALYPGGDLLMITPWISDM